MSDHAAYAVETGRLRPRIYPSWTGGLHQRGEEGSTGFPAAVGH